MKGLLALYVVAAVCVGLVFVPGLVVMRLIMPGYESRLAVVYSGTVLGNASNVG